MNREGLNLIIDMMFIQMIESVKIPRTYILNMSVRRDG